jgi:hypothetical protein
MSRDGEDGVEGGTSVSATTKVATPSEEVSIKCSRKARGVR